MNFFHNTEIFLFNENNILSQQNHANSTFEYTQIWPEKEATPLRG